MKRPASPTSSSTNSELERYFPKNTPPSTTAKKPKVTQPSWMNESSYMEIYLELGLPPTTSQKLPEKMTGNGFNTTALPNAIDLSTLLSENYGSEINPNEAGNTTPNSLGQSSTSLEGTNPAQTGGFPAMSYQTPPRSPR